MERGQRDRRVAIGNCLVSRSGQGVHKYFAPGLHRHGDSNLAAGKIHTQEVKPNLSHLVFEVIKPPVSTNREKGRKRKWQLRVTRLSRCGQSLKTKDSVKPLRGKHASHDAGWLTQTRPRETVALPPYAPFLQLCLQSFVFQLSAFLPASGVSWLR